MENILTLSSNHRITPLIIRWVISPSYGQDFSFDEITIIVQELENYDINTALLTFLAWILTCPSIPILPYPREWPFRFTRHQLCQVYDLLILYSVFLAYFTCRPVCYIS